MRSLLGRFHRPNARSQSEQLFMLNNLGDGSTLSLDFTTGVLDPRLTFTRTTNATFINSQGYVEWANANMYWNTAFEGLSGTNPSLTSSGWGYALSTAGSAVFNGDGTMTVTTTASDRRAIFRSTGFTGNGLRVVAAVDVTIHSGSLTASQVIVTGTPTNAQHYVNGVIWNSSHPIWNGGVLPSGTSFNIAYATDSLTGSTTSIYFGVGCTSAIEGSATFSNPRWTMWKGSGTVPYYPNTSATNNSTTDRYKSNDYQDPRFDYDPTALTPRGLLIEGSAINLFNWSESFETTGGAVNWNFAAVNVTRGTVTTTNPTGSSATVIKIQETNANGIHAALTTPGASVSTAYTFSVWAKAVERTFLQLLENGGSGANNMVNLSNGNIVSESSSGITTVTPLGTTGWYRIAMRLTTAAGQTTANCQFRLSTDGTTTSYTGTTGNGVYIWGAQLEAGSGASSYIPTGASQGSRAVDFCTMPTASFIPGNPYPQTFFVDCIPNTPSSAFLNIARIFDRTGGGAFSYGTEIYYYNASTMTVGRKITASTNTDRSFASGLSYGTRHKFALSIDASSYSGSYDGVTALGVATAPTALATVATHLGIGCSGDSSPASIMFGTIRQIKFYPTALSQSAINTLTTL